MIALIIFHDGRNEYLTKTLSSFSENVMDIPKYSLIINDSANTDGVDIAKRYGVKRAVLTGGGRGIFKSIETAWAYIREHWPEVTHIFHQENDFTYNEKIPVTSMLRVLDNKNVIQIALKRQAWYKPELRYGGFMEYLNSIKPKSLVDYNINGIDIVTHRQFFTNNPSIYRIADMPEVYKSEYDIRNYFKSKNANWTCTFLGKLKDEPKVHHIGEVKI